MKKIKNILISFMKYLFVVLVFIGLSSCKKNNENNENKQDEPPKIVELDSSDIYKKVNSSVVLVLTSTIFGDVCSGTGFFIDNNGTFITNYHVINNAYDIVIKTFDNQVITVDRFISVNKEQDIAILKANVSSTPVEIGDSDSIEVGDKVYTIGYPAVSVMGMATPTFTDGMISKVSQFVNGKDYIQTTVSITNGNSGGPLINKYGQVVGVTTAGFNYDNIDWANLAVGINYSKNLDQLPDEEVNYVRYYFRQEVPYVVKFMYDGVQHDIQTAFYNGYVSKPIDPYNPGYYVKYWVDQNTYDYFDFNARIKQNYTLVPIFEKNTYTISFNTNGGSSINDVDYVYEDYVDLSKYVSTKLGYTFAGWDQNITSMPYNDITLNAVWVPNGDTPFTVNFYYKNELGIEEFKESKTYYGTTGEMANIPDELYYKLEYENTEILPDGTTIVKCYLVDNYLTINYHMNNGEAVKSDKIKLIDLKNYKTPTSKKEDLTFECWYVGEDASAVFNADDYIDAIDDTTLNLYAKYKEETLWTNFEYDLDKNSIVDFIGSINGVIIPTYILDTKITRISNGAFSNSLDLYYVLIPNDILSVDGAVFSNCPCITIYCEIDKPIDRPNGWAYNWNNDERIVYWGVNNLYIDNNTVYVLNDETQEANLTQYFGSDSNVIIEKNVSCNNTNYTVTSVAERCFIYRDKLLHITLPDTLKDIGENAFYFCDNIESMTLPYVEHVVDGVTLVFFNYIFGETCIPESLTKIYINGGTIFGWNFYGCNVKEVYIANSVKNIKEGAFDNCDSITNVYYNGTIDDWMNVTLNYFTDNPKYVAEHFYLLDDINNYYEPSIIEIPENVTEINKYQFYNFDTLKTVSMNNNIKSIKAYAFSGCSNLLSINISDNVTTIDNGVFENCSKIQEIIFSKNSQLKQIGSYAFSNCSNLIRFNIPKNVEYIKDYAFSDCSKIQEIIFSENSQLKQIGSYAFSYCSNLSSINIHNNIKEINEYAFKGCTGLINVIINNSSTTVHHDSFESCPNIKYNIYENGKYLGNENNPYMFLFSTIDTNVESVTIHENTKVIQSRSIAECNRISNIIIPNSIERLESGAIFNCTYLRYITVPFLGNTRDENRGYFGHALGGTTGNNLFEITIQSATHISNFAFSDFENLRNVILPDNIESISISAFEGCTSLTGNAYENGVYIGSKNNPYMMFVSPSDKKIKSIKLHDNTKFIHQYAFRDCTSLKNITIPSGVEEMGLDPFYNCYNLEFNIYDNACYIGNSTNPYLILVKAKDTRIKSCNIHNNTKFITSGAFISCKNLTEIIIPSNVRKIDLETFSSCTNLVSVEISYGVTHIGYDAFSSCYSLKNLIIPNSVTHIEKSAFDGCKSLESVIIPDSVIYLGERAFGGCNKLTDVKLSKNLTSIDNKCFAACNSLSKIVIPKSVLYIANDSFIYCDNITFYCEADEKPDKWDETWNNNRPVIWGYTE